jgi:hypothetical protein
MKFVSTEPGTTRALVVGAIAVSSAALLAISLVNHRRFFGWTTECNSPCNSLANAEDDDVPGRHGSTGRILKNHTTTNVTDIEELGVGAACCGKGRQSARQVEDDGGVRGGKSADCSREGEGLGGLYGGAPLKIVHLEITDKCNAACPQCARNDKGGAVNPLLPLVELSCADIRQMLPVSRTSHF